MLIIVNLEIGKHEFSALFFFRIVLAIIGPLNLHMNFRISLLISANRLYWVSFFFFLKNDFLEKF